MDHFDGQTRCDSPAQMSWVTAPPFMIEISRGCCLEPLLSLNCSAVWITLSNATTPTNHVILHRQQFLCGRRRPPRRPRAARVGQRGRPVDEGNPRRATDSPRRRRLPPWPSRRLGPACFQLYDDLANAYLWYSDEFGRLWCRVCGFTQLIVLITTNNIESHCGLKMTCSSCSDTTPEVVY